jgi:hypothetical protein
MVETIKHLEPLVIADEELAISALNVECERCSSSRWIDSNHRPSGQCRRKKPDEIVIPIRQQDAEMGWSILTHRPEPPSSNCRTLNNLAPREAMVGIEESLAFIAFSGKKQFGDRGHVEVGTR